MEKISIIDNFLAEEEFIVLRDKLIHPTQPWYFSTTFHTDHDTKISPGGFVHHVYYDCAPRSTIYDSHFISILKQLNVSILIHTRMNIHLRLPEPYVSPWHTDTEDLSMDLATQITTSILYINTNNGYTELEDGTKIESVANSLVSFPSNTKHRIVTQTDEQTRIIINFNYLK